MEDMATVMVGATMTTKMMKKLEKTKERVGSQVENEGSYPYNSIIYFVFTQDLAVACLSRIQIDVLLRLVVISFVISCEGLLSTLSDPILGFII